MNKKWLACLLALALCLCAAGSALAANVFLFSDKTLTLHEGDTVETELRREGVYAGDGEIEYSSSRPQVADISADGVITAKQQGQATVSASLIRKGKRVGKAQMTVRVVKPVTKVTLNTDGLALFDAMDETVSGLLEEATEYRVIAVAVGTSVTLSATCTPEDAGSRAVTYTTTDAGIARIANGKVLKGMQRGECDLIVASAQDPEVTETYHVLVTQPVKKIQISAPSKSVEAGLTLQLTAECLPESASIKGVTWASKNPGIASVDADGRVTGLKRGNATITATAADGSKATGSFAVTVTQPVTGITFSQQEIPVIVGKTAQAKVTVLPADASDKTVDWSTSDGTIATVKAGKITGLKAGTCTLTCTSRSDPDVSAQATLIVTQPVTSIKCINGKDELSLLTGETIQLEWEVLPEDANVKTLSFRSAHPKIVSVDSSGTVTALSRGTGTIIATSQDGAKRQGSVKVTVIQPVTGVSFQKPLYYVQRGCEETLRAVVEPRNANNQKVRWSSDDESVATVRSNGTSTGCVTGYTNGTATVTATTDDGGFTASTTVRVGNFDAAVMVEDLYVDANNKIRIVLRNMTEDITLDRIYFHIDCYDMGGAPMICNKDGYSTGFDGYYPFEVAPLDRTVHGSFRFQDYVIDEPIGAVILTVTGWRDTESITWKIPETERVPRQWTRLTPDLFFGYHEEDLEDEDDE
uniref:Transglutaminase domain-containing protein n=1 Tax=uncultured bacterium Contig1756 TaxID=1393499 RepID=W0FM00_9BACT|nr:transglutaminase domain-containing protein [uncultured bacterium Contig1756]